ncbi:hypothetical protein vnz_28440 [Streptomyces venezuelae]|nr:hypothetical protein vnz_28440 [Streptomyces venezuelae]
MLRVGLGPGGLAGALHLGEAAVELVVQGGFSAGRGVAAGPCIQGGLGLVDPFGSFGGGQHGLGEAGEVGAQGQALGGGHGGQPVAGFSGIPPPGPFRRHAAPT